MFVLKRIISISCVLSWMLWSCRVSSASRIRRRVTRHGTSANFGQENRIHDASIERQRDLSSESTEVTTCASIGVDGFDPCAAYCSEKTGVSLNTFIEMDTSPSSKQYCCACFSGNAYCSDDIPECIQYVNLDVGELNIEWKQYNESEATVAPSHNISCIDMNVTNTLSCIDFCEEKTGNSTKYEFRSDNNTNLFYCVCNSTLLGGGGTPSYCSDNVPISWIAALTNSSILPIERMGILP